MKRNTQTEQAVGRRKTFGKGAKKYRVQNGDLYYNRLLVPRSKAHIEEYCKRAHEGTCMRAVISHGDTVCCCAVILGHLSQQDTLQVAKSNFHWATLRRDVLKFVKRCQHCSAKQVSHIAWSVSLINCVGCGYHEVILHLHFQL